MIPRHIHQVWVGPYRMPERESGFVSKMKSMHPSFQHTLWTDKNTPEMPAHMAECFNLRMFNREYAFAADILRVWVAHTQGGVYLDVDDEPIEGLNGLHLDTLTGLFSHSTASDPTMSNDFIGLSAGSALGRFLISTIRSPAYAFGPHWLGYAVKSYLNLLPNTSHEVVREACTRSGILYMPRSVSHPGGESCTVWESLFTNHALYSWSKENTEKFATGDYV